MKTLKQFANAFARKHGRGTATRITISDEIAEPKLGEVVEFGYRKKTTDEYVPNAYLNNFGWKNTYYQHAVTEVIIPAAIAAQFE